MTKIKVDGALATKAQESLERLTTQLYNRPGMRIVAVVELAHVERTQPAPDEDKEAVVKLGIKSIEVADTEQEEHLRQVLRALYTQRTAYGTLDPDGEVELGEQTLRLAGGMMHAVDAARLRTVVKHWAHYAEQATFGHLTQQQLLEELKTIAGGLRAALEHGGE
jgi:hypothetical protein